MMLHAIHLIPMPFEHIGVQARALLATIRLSRQKTPTITQTRCENPETVNVLHWAVNDFIRWTGQIPACVYVSSQHYYQMLHWGFDCYYAALGSQSGYHEVRIKMAAVDPYTAICVGRL